MKDPKLSSYVKDYVALRSTYIKNTDWEAKVVGRFARFADKQGVKIVTRPLLWAFLESIESRAPSVKSYTIGYIRQFCLYLRSRDERHIVPEYRFVAKHKSELIPYIFSESEVKRMMHHARHKLWLGPQRLIVPGVYETLIGLLWATGMRISEAVNLNVGDVDFENGIIRIRETKFYKSRLLPIHESTCEALKAHLIERNSFNFPKEPDRPFFFNWRMRMSKRGRYTTDAFHQKIREIIIALNIKGKTGRYARPYDLRHSFATRRLAAIYGEPEVIRRLPLIATYMGHAKLSYTQIYLHPSIELMAKLGKNFLTFFERETT